MWRRSDIGFELAPEHCQGGIDTVRIFTPIGDFLLMGIFEDVTMDALRITGAHTNGAWSGKAARNIVGLANLMVIAQAFMEGFGYAEIIVEGSNRASGRRAGKRPRPIRFTRHGENPA